MDKKKMKPYVTAALLIVLYIGEIFWLSDILGRNLGLAGTVLHEAVLALIGVVTFVLMRGKLKIIFPFKKPEFKKLAGTVVLWLGAYIGTMVITMIIAYFFPEEVMGASQDIQGLIMETPVWISIFVVAVTPAICEEIAFRGALLSSLMSFADADGMMDTAMMMASTEIPLATVGVYIMYGGAAPLLVYVGNYLIHRGQDGYENGLFPRKKRKTLAVLIAVSLGMFLLGAVLIGISIAGNMRYYMY